MAGPRIPQIDPELIAQLAQAKGQAAAAPFSAVGTIIKELNLKKEKDEQKAAKKISDELMDKLKQQQVQLGAMKAGLQPVGQQPGQPMEFGGRQFLPPTATTAKKGFVTLTPERIKKLEDRGTVAKGTLIPDTQVKTSEYLKLVKTGKTTTRLIKADKPFVDFVKKRLGADFPVSEGDEMTASERANLRKLAVDVKRGKVGEAGKLTDVQKVNIRSVTKQKSELIKLVKNFSATQEDVDKLNNTIREVEASTGVRIGTIPTPPAKEEDKSAWDIFLNTVTGILSRLGNATPGAKISLGKQINKSKKVKGFEELG
jgi:hypothetical protein